MLKINKTLYNSHICNSNQDINTKIYKRNLPSKNLEPYYLCRPVETKQIYQPILDERELSSIKLINYPTYNIEHIFNPGDRMGPWSGFAGAIDDESVLRNQIYSTQEAAIYIPDSSSELYNRNNYLAPIKNSEHFPNFNPNKYNLGFNIFNNATREQLLDVCQNKKE